MISTTKLNQFLDKYGCEVALSTNGQQYEETYKAFVQPLRYKNKMYLEGVHTPAGYTDQSYYLYVGPGDKDITKLPRHALLKTREMELFFSHSEAVRLADQTVYMWAILRSYVKEENRNV